MSKILNPNLISEWHDSNSYLGRGAFGQVNKAYYGGTPVAMKTMIKNGTVDLKIAHQKELENIQRLRHPNIVSLITYDETRIIMDLAHGNATQIDDPHELTLVASDCMRALNFMHIHMNCMIHGDIKPENILVYKDSFGNIVKAVLGDVGLSRGCVNKGIAFLGTPGFMPPGEPTVFHDIHALGVSLVNAWMAPGKFVTSKTVEQNITFIPVPLQEIVSLMVIAYVNQEFQESDTTAAQFMLTITKVLNDRRRQSFLRHVTEARVKSHGGITGEKIKLDRNKTMGTDIMDQSGNSL